jgi:hypothetical protein
LPLSIIDILSSRLALLFNEIGLKEIPSLLFEFLSKGEGTFGSQQ